jgi:hypothetical protein
VGIEAELAEVAELCRTVKMTDAEDRMRAILRSLTSAELRAVEMPLKETIESVP